MTFLNRAFTPCSPMGSSFLGSGPVPLRSSNGADSSRAILQVRNAMTRDQKAEKIAVLKEKLSKSMLVAGMDYTNMSVKYMQGLRRALPPNCSVVVAKNTLVGVAIKDDPKLAKLNQLLEGPKAWLLADEDNVAAAVKAVRKYEKENKAEDKFKGAVLDGQFIPADQITKLESLPTKLEVITKVAVSIKMVTTKVALGIKAVPRSVGYAAKALADKKAEEAGEQPSA
eukprot:jgi/Mesvir1/6884/Mv09049-RA.1